MIGRIVLLAIFGLVSLSAYAQEEGSRVDLSGGYSVVRADGFTTHGWYGDAAARARGALYIVGEVSGYYYSDSQIVSGVTSSVDTSKYIFAAGPRWFITRRLPIISPFVQVLAGAGRTSGESTSTGTGGP